MRRLLLILAAWAIAFAPSAASAQGLLLLGVGAARTSGGGGGYVGPGDIVGSAKAWYGLRAYSAAKAAAQAPAVRLIRADTHQCDVNVTTAGGLANVVGNCSTPSDNAGVLTNGSTGWADGTTPAVIIWYDQSGNAVDASNAGGSRPALTFNCIGALPCVTFNGTNYLSSTVTSTNQPLTVSTVAIRTGTFTSQNDILSGASGAFFPNAANQYGGYFGSSGSATASDSAWHALQLVVNDASSVVNVDGTESTITLGINAMPASAFIGAQSSTPTSPLTGKIAEVGEWGAGFTTGGGAQANLECHNQKTYYGITATC